MAVTPLPLEVAIAVQRLGENVRIARIRRRMSQDELAQACGITRKTLYALETGTPSVALGTAFAALWALGLLETATAIGHPDTDDHGKTLEAARRPKRVRNAAADDNDF
jgi:DNA-binding XRE family transcriptional regulator